MFGGFTLTDARAKRLKSWCFILVICIKSNASMYGSLLDNHTLIATYSLNIQIHMFVFATVHHWSYHHSKNNGYYYYNQVIWHFSLKILKNDAGRHLVFIIFKKMKTLQNWRSSSFEGCLKKVLEIPTKTFSNSVHDNSVV